MGVLDSKLFTEGDAATVQKLEDCATGRPNEVASHFNTGKTGEHIRKVQQALQNIKQRNPKLGIPSFTVNGVYDSAFAAAVKKYKTERGIKNYAGKFDDIIGVKTIRNLDDENHLGEPKPSPAPDPAPAPTETKDRRLMFKQTFEEYYGDPVELQGGDEGQGEEFYTLGKLIWDTWKAHQQEQQNPIEGSDVDDGKTISKKEDDVLSSFVMTRVVINERAVRKPNYVTFGLYAIRIDKTRDYTYFYGPGRQADLVSVQRTRQFVNLDGQTSNSSVSQTCKQPSNYTDPR